MAVELEQDLKPLPISLSAEKGPALEPGPASSVITALQRGPGNLAVARLVGRLAVGQSLDPATRAFMESRFGRQLGGVRVHTGPDATASARTLGAAAFTIGRDIAFADGRYRPDRPEGQRLIAHELAHVVQQEDATSKAMVAYPDGRAEQEAKAAVHAVAAGDRVKVSPRLNLAIARDDGSPDAGPPPAAARVMTGAEAEGIARDEANTMLPAGMEAIDAAALRDAYARGCRAIYDEAQLMLSKGAGVDQVADWANAARNQLKGQIREEGPRIIKVIAEARNVRRYGNPLGPSAEELRAAGKSSEEILESAGRAGRSVSRWAGRLRIAGRILIVIDIGISAYRVAMAPEVDRPRVLFQEVGGLGGALAGGWAGAKLGGLIGGGIGAWFGGAGAVPGAAIGAVIGGIAGAIGGSWAGRRLGDFVASEFYPPAQTRFEGIYTTEGGR